MRNTNDLTLIIGANCQDGVVLVGDKKITVGQGTDFGFAKKIFMPFNQVIVGSSGMSGIFRDFQARLRVEVANLQEAKKDQANINWQEELVLLAGRIIRGMGDEYGTDFIHNNFQAFVAVRLQSEPELLAMGGLGMPQPVTSYDAIGHGDPYASVILKILWSKIKPKRMQEAAKIFCLAIRYVQDLELDLSVGIDTKNNDFPQVYYFPKISQTGIEQMQKAESEEALEAIKKVYEPRELDKFEVDNLMQFTTSNIQSIKNAIENVRF